MGNRSLLVSSLMLVYVPNDAFDLGMADRDPQVAAAEKDEVERFQTVRTDQRSDWNEWVSRGQRLVSCILSTRHSRMSQAP
jgi:hypothetical protein